jgi:amino acid permease
VGTARLRVVTFNLLCTTLGVGVLAIPHVLSTVGLFGGLTLLVIVPLLAERSASFIADSSRRTGAPLLHEAVEVVFGRAASKATQCTLALYSFCSCLGQLVVLKQLLPPLLRLCGWAHPPTLTVLGALATVLLVPLSSMETMERLKFTSLASVLLQAVIALTIGFAGWRAYTSHQAVPFLVRATSAPPPTPYLVLEPLAWMRSTPVIAFGASRSHAPSRRHHAPS